MVQTFTGFCSNLGVRGLFSSPFVSCWAHIDWLAPGYLMGAGNPTISWETETQVWATCQPWQPHNTSSVRSILLVTPWTVARQAPLSMGFPRQEYWSGLPFLSPGDLPNPGIEPMAPASPALPTNSLLLSYLGNPSRTQVNQTQPSSNNAFQGESHSAIFIGGPGSHLFLFKDHTCDSVTHYTCSPPSSW